LFYRDREMPDVAARGVGTNARSSRLTAEFLAENGFL